MIAHKDDDKEYQSQYSDTNTIYKKYNDIDLTSTKKKMKTYLDKR